MPEQPPGQKKREPPQLLSVVIPCFNEQENVWPLYERLAAVLNTLPFPSEILYIENGSHDATGQHLEALVQKDPRVRVLVFTRNFGYQGAISAGLEFAKGDAVVVMDGDLQDPPELIPLFLGKWQEGFFIVYGTRAKRQASFFYQMGYKAFYRLLRSFAYIDIPLDASDFALMDRRVVDVLNRMPERDRLIRCMRAFTGFRHTGIPYERPARERGFSHFTFMDYLRFAQRSIFAFSYKPLEMISLLALVVVGLACVAAIGFVVLRFTDPNLPRGFSTLILTMLFLGGVQLLGLAILGEYVGRLFEETKRRPHYVVMEELGLSPTINSQRWNL